MRTNSGNVELIADDTPSAGLIEGDGRKPRVAPKVPALALGQLGDVIEQLTTDATPLPSLQNRHASQLNSGGNAAAATPLHPCMDYVAELSRKYQVRKQRKTTHADTSKKCKLLGWPKIEKKTGLRLRKWL